MLIPIHEDMTREALTTHVSLRALDNIIAANCNQDSFLGLFGHGEFHFDNNEFDKTYRYINEQRGLVVSSLLSDDAISAWAAFGRLTHTVQDFYSHTNYVSMWLEACAEKGAPPAAPEIDPVQTSLIESLNLYSSKVYFPMDWLYFVPFLRNLSLALLPYDSHGWMNLDSPKQGYKFEYARVAAIKRTRLEFEISKKMLAPEMLAKFTDL